jgi:hypothetical protein
MPRASQEKEWLRMKLAAGANRWLDLAGRRGSIRNIHTQA